MVSTETKVVSIDSLTPFVSKVILEAKQELAYRAGQYLQVVMSETDKRPFSIANKPSKDGLLELHIGASPDNPYAFEVVERAKKEKKLQVEVGLGEAFLRDSDKDVVLVAGGTGYTYAKSILLDALATQIDRRISLYWGAKNLEDLYEYDELMHLANTHSHFTFIPVLENAPEFWQSKTGLVHEAVLEDYPNMDEIQVYVAGRFEMAATIKQSFLPKGLKEDCLFGDAFSFL